MEAEEWDAGLISNQGAEGCGSEITNTEWCKPKWNANKPKDETDILLWSWSGPHRITSGKGKGLWILDCGDCKTVVWNRKRQIVGTGIFFFLIEFKVWFFKISKNAQIIWIGSGSETGSGSGSRILAQFGSGSRSGFRVIQSILKEQILNNFREK